MKVDYQTLPRHDVLCIDMRSFYASVEAVRLGFDPAKVLLAVVGDLSRPGSIVLAASPALKKKHGIRNVSRYYELPNDPDIQIVQANMADYLHTSLQIIKLLHTFAPQEAIHPYSIDEVWVTVNGLSHLFGTPFEIANLIQREIFELFGLSSSIGIGDNKFLAKVVMDLHAKKTANGIAECRYEEVPDKLWPFPVKSIWGVGSRLEKRLYRLGITTLGQLARYPLSTLKKHFGIMGEQLYYHAWGIDLSPVIGDFIKHEHKSFGHGISLLKDYTREETFVCILELCEETCRRARTANKVGKTIQLGIGYATQGGFHRSKSLAVPTHITTEMFAICTQLFNQFYDGYSQIRQVFVTLTHLFDHHITQLNLFNQRDKQLDLSYAMDHIREHHGSTALLRASSYTEAGIMLERSRKIGGHWAQSEKGKDG